MKIRLPQVVFCLMALGFLIGCSSYQQPTDENTIKIEIPKLSIELLDNYKLSTQDGEESVVDSAIPDGFVPVDAQMSDMYKSDILAEVDQEELNAALHAVGLPSISLLSEQDIEVLEVASIPAPEESLSTQSGYDGGGSAVVQQEIEKQIQAVSQGRLARHDGATIVNLQTAIVRQGISLDYRRSMLVWRSMCLTFLGRPVYCWTHDKWMGVLDTTKQYFFTFRVIGNSTLDQADVIELGNTTIRVADLSAGYVFLGTKYSNYSISLSQSALWSNTYNLKGLLTPSLSTQSHCVSHELYCPIHNHINPPSNPTPNNPYDDPFSRLSCTIENCTSRHDIWFNRMIRVHEAERELNDSFRTAKAWAFVTGFCLGATTVSAFFVGPAPILGCVAFGTEAGVATANLESKWNLKEDAIFYANMALEEAESCYERCGYVSPSFIFPTRD